MRALVLERPGVAEVREIPDPVARPGEVVVEVARVGICGTDAELFRGGLTGADYPRVPGHEWSGTIVEVGAGVARSRIGRRVAGDTFVGCGACRACARGRASVCPDRAEIGVKRRDGAAARYLAVPDANALPVPDGLDDPAAALIEPASNAVRAVAELRQPVDDALVLGAGTLGLLAGRLLAARGVAVTLVDPDPAAVDRARALGAVAELAAPAAPVDAIVDLAPGSGADALLPLLRDGGTLVVTGFPAADRMVALRDLVERDLRVVGTLGAVDRLAETAELLARGELSIGGIVGPALDLDAAADLLAHSRVREHPKTQIDPALPSRGSSR